MRVISALSRWVETCYGDFDEVVKQSLKQLYSSIRLSGMERQVDQIENRLHTKVRMYCECSHCDHYVSVSC